MPPQKSSPRPRKINTMAKPKGAVRAKSGCYTCRIRRKKCDEKRLGEEGSCETCFRLKLECLGFGAKRPDWLRESSRVSAIRDKIKAHLAAQGMIKGHSGSGSRSAVQEDCLRLSEFREGDILYPSDSSTSESPHPRDISEESDRPNYHALSFNPSTTTMRSHYDMYSPDFYPHDDIRSSRCVSPFMQHNQFPELDDSMMNTVNPFTNEFSPALRSLFSARNLYHLPADWDIDDDYDFINQHSSGILTIPAVYPSNLVPQELVNASLREYVNNVVKVQYLLGDNNILPRMIWEAIEVHEESREAVNLLSQIYSRRRQDPQRQVLCDIPFKARVEGLQATLTATGRLASSADDAMAALHVISLFLFDGGQGGWNVFLNVASTYVMTLLENPKYHRNYSTALQACGPKDEFIVKTTIWFDVLASITTQEQPRLLSAIRELFDPNRSYIGGSSVSYSMMSPMGCENIVVWALAEASSLSCWKRANQRRGALSRRELVHKAEQIETHLESQIPLPQPSPETPEGWSRLLASQIFRSSTKLFLQSIVNGDHPRIPELREAVVETFKSIMNLPTSVSNNKPAIVRSTVFGIFLCGSLTDDQKERQSISLHLKQGSGADGVGNTSTVLRLLEHIWDTREKSPSSSVPWRRLLKEAQILLV